MAEFEVAKLRFRGGVYDNNVLDASALQVIVAIQKVLTNLAKKIDTDREGSSITDHTRRFVIRWIEAESASSLIESVENSRSSNDLQSSDELHQATKLLYKTFAAAAKGEKPPRRLPLDQVNCIASVVDTLCDDSVLEFSYSGSEFQSISHQTCSTVRDWVDSSYEDKTTLTGRVSQVNLKFGL